MITRRPLSALALLAVAGLSLTACSGGDDETPTRSATANTTPSASAEAAPSEDLVPLVEEELGADAEWTTAIEESEPGRIMISTDLIDNREDNSADGMRAVTLCNGAARVDGVEYVSVAEADGTTWVLYGHPSVPEGECAEV